MKGFRRSYSGISNQHLFYGVDLIVYLEGGPRSFNKEDVYKGAFHEETEDIIFWRNLFERFKSSTKVKFKSIGSKSTIKDIALDIVDGKIHSVFVAMDNEFDEVLNKKIEHEKILYTYGYSWENDVWNNEVVRHIIQELSAIEITPEDIQDNFIDFLSKVRIGVLADCYLFEKGDSFFPRKGHLVCVNCEPKDLPNVKKEVINQLIIKKNLKPSTINSYGRRKGIDVKKHCYGHLLADYCCQVIMHYLRNRLQLPSVNKSIIYRMGLRKYFQFFFDNTAIQEYYRGQFNKNEAQQNVYAIAG